MTECLKRAASLRRPRLLIRAARHGQADYSRDKLIQRMTQLNEGPCDDANLLSVLIDAEDSLEESRRRGDAAYSVARHVELLIAVMAEARRLLCRAPAM